jgi:hypothetical protein
MQRQIFRFGLVYGLVGVLLLAGAATGCKKKRYNAPTYSPSTGDALLGGSGGVAQQIRLWTQVSDSQAVPGEQASVKMIAYVKDSLGQPMPDGTVVVWLATIGSLDTSTSTTKQGVASATLKFPPNFTECSRVTAICGEAQATEKACASVNNNNIAIWASHTDIAWDGAASVTAKLITDGKPDVGYQVDFTVTVTISEFADADDFIVNVRPGLTVLTDGEGNATIYLEVENLTDEAAYITVTAKAEDERTASLVILVQPEP